MLLNKDDLISVNMKSSQFPLSLLPQTDFIFQFQISNLTISTFINGCNFSLSLSLWLSGKVIFPVMLSLFLRKGKVLFFSCSKSSSRQAPCTPLRMALWIILCNWPWELRKPYWDILLVVSLMTYYSLPSTLVLTTAHRLCLLGCNENHLWLNFNSFLFKIHFPTIG